MTTIDDLQTIASQLESADKALEKVSHYKVNRKIYELMKNAEYSSIVYHARLDALLLNGKPVFIDEDLKDGIATYERKELEVFEPLDFYNVHLMTVKPMPVRPIDFTIMA